MIKQLIVLASIMAAPVFATDYTISTGKAGGSYSKTGDAFVKLIPGGTNVNTNGSVDNLSMLLSGKSQFGVVQLDTWAKHLTTNPEDADTVEELGVLYDECLHVAAAKGGGVTSDDDLQDKRRKVAIGKQGSGTWSTWNYMLELEDKFKRPKVSNSYGSRALAKMMSSRATIDAVIWMSREDINNKMLIKVRNNPKLEMIPVDDMDLNDNHPVLKRPVYTFKKIVVSEGMFDTKVKTICTQAVILVRSDTDETLLDKAAELMVDNLNSLINR